jgi:hypothetical protein
MGMTPLVYCMKSKGETAMPASAPIPAPQARPEAVFRARPHGDAQCRLLKEKPDHEEGDNGDADDPENLRLKGGAEDVERLGRGERRKHMRFLAPQDEGRAPETEGDGDGHHDQVPDPRVLNRPDQDPLNCRAEDGGDEYGKPEGQRHGEPFGNEGHHRERPDDKELPLRKADQQRDLVDDDETDGNESIDAAARQAAE